MSSRETAEGIYERGHFFPGSDPNVTKEQVIREIEKSLDRIASGDYELGAPKIWNRKLDVRDLSVLLDHGIDHDKAVKIARDLLEKRDAKSLK